MKIVRTKTTKAAPRMTLRFPALAPLRNTTGLLSKLWLWLMEKQRAHSQSKTLKLEETLSLGQKRFVAVIQVNGERYLVGGGATDVALLAKLDKKESFGDYLKETETPQLVPPVKKTRKRTTKPKVQKCA